MVYTGSRYTGAGGQTYQDWQAEQQAEQARADAITAGYQAENPGAAGRPPAGARKEGDERYRYGGKTGFGEAVADFWTPQGLVKTPPRAATQQPRGATKAGEMINVSDPNIDPQRQSYMMDEGLTSMTPQGLPPGQAGPDTKRFGGQSGLGEVALKALTLGKG